MPYQNSIECIGDWVDYSYMLLTPKPIADFFSVDLSDVYGSILYHWPR